MPLHLISPFDSDTQSPPGDEPPSLPAPPARRWRQPFTDLCFILVKAGAFLGAIYLMVLGLPLLFFLLLVGGDVALLFAQLGNLSAHYLAADHARQASFGNALKLAFLGLATLAAIWRLPRFLDDVCDTLAARKDMP